MPSNCVICGNSALKDPGASFHRLPSSTGRKRQWLIAFGVSEEDWCPHWRVCSRHFPDGNPKSTPQATTWTMRKRNKLHQATSRQKSKDYLNTLLAMRAHGALPHPFSVNTTTTTSTVTGSVADEPRVIRARSPPVLLPVASLARSTSAVGGPVTVITNDPLSASAVRPQVQAGIHVHELLVVPDLDPANESSSESSGSDDSVPALNSERESAEVTVSRVDRDESGIHVVNLAPTVECNHQHTSSVDHTAMLRVDHSAASMINYKPGVDHTTTAESSVDQCMSMPRHSDQSSRDVSVLVQSALLARIEALNKENQQLRQKLTLPSSPPPTARLCVHVTDSSVGRPAEGVSVEVSVWQDITTDWTSLSSGVTDEDGVWSAQMPQPQLSPGLYRLHFDTQSYFTLQGHEQPYYPYVEVVFRLESPTPCHEISLQLSPFSYTTSSSLTSPS